MFCEESLGKIKLRAFPKSVGPRIILSLESVDYFGTGEHYCVVEKNKNHKTAKYFGNKSEFFCFGGNVSNVWVTIQCNTIQ